MKENQKIKDSHHNDQIEIKRIILNEVTYPSNDGSAGSGLYKIPFELNKSPSEEWISIFKKSFNLPKKTSLGHRPGIASVSGNKIYLNGTTIEEVEKYLNPILKLAVRQANEKYQEIMIIKQSQDDQEKLLKLQHRNNIEERSKNLSFKTI